MTKRFLLSLLPFLLTLPLYAQNEIVEDTLDWRGYYPLEIGNAWEWDTFIMVAYTAKDFREIIGDTLIENRSYFIQESYRTVNDPLNGIDLTQIGRLYLRYDSLSTRIMSRSDTVTGEWEYTCDLSADFGSMADCQAYVHGTYEEEEIGLFVGSEPVSSRAVKSYLNLGGATHYYYGIGRLPDVGDGAVGSIGFSYVKIGDREYGVRSIYVGVEKEGLQSRFSSQLQVFPNPTQGNLNVMGQGVGVALEIVDILGRVLETVDTCSERICRIDVSKLSSGLYFVRPKFNDGITGQFFVVQ